MKRTGTALALCLALAGATCACDEPHRSRTYQLPPAADEPRPVIYELVVRLFSNTASVNQWNGDLETNGVGKLEQIDSAAIEGLRELGVTHVWLAGVLQQATATGYPEIGQPADDPDVLKGLAGSIYAVRDYFDICPDYAVDPAQRAEEFAALVDRLHQHELKVIIDLVPNHVARTYHSEIRPDLDFGAGDDPAVFFDPQNDFFYLVEPPGQSLSLPEPSHWPRPDGADGTLESEDNDGVPPGDVPRATGNNVTSPSPGENDWYETIKLNYGYDFTTGAESYDPIPGVWEKMDRVIAHWQGVGVDGFRCDFAHYVPLEAWSHLIDAARERDPDVFFFAEAYEAADAVPGFSFSALVQSGFDAVYDDRTYDTIKGIHCCGRWANDIDGVLPDDYMFDRMLRYAENHDERRIASPLVGGDNPDDSGFGGFDRATAAVGALYLLGSGPLLIYNGQEVGEEGAGAEGFGGDDGRTTIFDYWTMPRLAEWVADHAYDGSGLSEERRGLREWYGRVVELAQREGFATGNYYGLQSFNAGGGSYGDGRWIHSFLRYDAQSGAAWLVVANFGEADADPIVRIPKEALQFMGFDGERRTLRFHDALHPEAAPIGLAADHAETEGVPLSVAAHGLTVLGIDQVD